MADRVQGDHRIYIVTGCDPGAGTDADIWVRFEGRFYDPVIPGDVLRWSRWCYCEGPGGNFETGSTDVFYYRKEDVWEIPARIEDIGYMELWFRPRGPSPAWKLDYIWLDFWNGEDWSNGYGFIWNRWIDETLTHPPAGTRQPYAAEPPRLRSCDEILKTPVKGELRQYCQLRIPSEAIANDRRLKDENER